MSKTIIDFDDAQFSFSDAAFYVGKVVNEGRISERNSYCAVTTFTNGTVVYAHRTEGGIDVFRVSS